MLLEASDADEGDVDENAVEGLLALSDSPGDMLLASPLLPLPKLLLELLLLMLPPPMKLTSWLVAGCCDSSERLRFVAMLLAAA